LGKASRITTSRYVKITGTGGNTVNASDPLLDQTYGFHVVGTKDGDVGFSITGGSSDIEIEFMEVENVGFAGIMAKTDLGCTYNDSNFTQYNTNLHDNWVHEARGGEGFYLGFSHYSDTMDCSGVTVGPHTLEGVKIYRNKIKNTGCEGIQVAAGITGVEVHDNTIENFGIEPFAEYQNNGLQVGEGTTGRFYNNRIWNNQSAVKMVGAGIIILGNKKASLFDNVTRFNRIEVFNNVVIDAGAVYIHDGAAWGGEVILTHNTFIRIQEFLSKNNSTGLPLSQRYFFTNSAVNTSNTHAKIKIADNVFTFRPARSLTVTGDMIPIAGDRSNWDTQYPSGVQMNVPNPTLFNFSVSAVSSDPNQNQNDFIGRYWNGDVNNPETPNVFGLDSGFAGVFSNPASGDFALNPSGSSILKGTGTLQNLMGQPIWSGGIPYSFDFSGAERDPARVDAGAFSWKP
jgi:hypothetical protein